MASMKAGVAGGVALAQRRLALYVIWRISQPAGCG